MTPLRAAITSDIDTLSSIYKGSGCLRPGGYTYAELRMGLEEFCRFLERYDIRSTLFMVGSDFCHSVNHDAIRAAARAGHEIANHTMTHPQGFRLLSVNEKDSEIGRMEQMCEQVVGSRPVGFRSPGWNIGDDTAAILRRRGYLYDSSVFPTFLMPALKAAHWYTMRSRCRADRTTMGPWRYMLAPAVPYRTASERLGVRGEDGLIEFPVTVVPAIRLPFFATFLLATGFELFVRSYRALRRAGWPIQFQFHLSDFVDYSHPDLVDQVPARGCGLYVPKALGMRLSAKLDLFRKVIDTIAADYSFVPLADWAREFSDSGSAVCLTP